MMKFINPTSNILDLNGIGLGKVAPGAAVWVEEYLYRPSRNAAGGRGISSIESTAPQMLPVAEAGWIAEWRSAPDAPVPVSRMVAVDGASRALPPAILAARAAFEAAAEATATGNPPVEAPAPAAVPVAAPAPARRGRPRKDADVAASNPGVTSGILDTED